MILSLEDEGLPELIEDEEDTDGDEGEESENF